MKQSARSLSPPSIPTLALVAAISPLCMNAFLPSLPSMAEYFETSSSTTQLTVSIYLLGTAIMQLILGPLSDIYGRRPVLLWSTVFMMLATLVCIFAPTIEVLLVGRILQSVGSAGIVLSRAIARDMVGGERAASQIAYITMGMALTPMLAPILGGYLEEWFGWQANFWLMFYFAGVVGVIMWLDLGETNQHKATSITSHFKSYPELVLSRRFWGYSLTLAFSAGAFFTYLGGAPLIGDEYYKLSPSEFGYYFVIIAIGYIAGNYVSARHSTRFGINPMMLAGNVIAAGGISMATVLSLWQIENPLAFFGFMFFVGLGNGITLPNANAGIVNVRPHIAGAASGLGATIMTGGGATMAALASRFITPENGPTGLLTIILGSLVCATLATLYVIAVEMSLEEKQ